MLAAFILAAVALAAPFLPMATAWAQ